MRYIFLCLLLLLILPASVDASTSFSVQPSVIHANSASPSATITIINSGDTEISLEYQGIFLEPQADGLLIPLVRNSEKPEIIRTDSTQDSPLLTLPAHSSVPLRFSFKENHSSSVSGILFFSQPSEIPSDKTATSLSGAIVVPILFTGKVAPYSISLAQYNASSFVFSNKADFVATVKNNTSGIAEVSGSLTIRNLTGNEVVRYDIPSTIVFGDQTRTLQPISWQPKLLIGIYSSELQLKFGDTITSHKRFLIGLPVPYALLLIFVGLLVSGICLRVVKYRN